MPSDRHGAVVLARVLRPHDETELDYHEWITLDERVRADRLGRLNPRVAYAAWVRWLCNNPDCHGEALVSDDSARLSIQEAESGR